MHKPPTTPNPFFLNKTESFLLSLLPLVSPISLFLARASYTHHRRRSTVAPPPYSVAGDAPKWAFSLVLKHPRETSPQNPKKKS
ncbi:hypothetical protein ES332_A09G065500v1 [Gossypium tomentosum]|uniref:Uncharacterized protein n=1 Tax=Gossypium tomentosum TaxID=34277 RepID=A0A5D2NZ38_GOSTO|nr:hypothetical protein ES332_A09G065500v1 [Gossypium tomentosum]